MAINTEIALLSLITDPTPILKEKIMAPKVTLRLNNADNVVVARVDLAPGALVEGNVTAQDHVPAGHKVATGPIAKAKL